ncbi:MAG: efflux RND transporter permease subunit [Prevotellaceae bacterium]|jgi:multidrug efflux pump|nr:efflux RND transporter permease subunit [Prevotellaceae bacterium]
MNIAELSIKRPVLSTVATIIILVFGAIGYVYLGVREFPSVDTPIITVNTTYTGANADVIENQITEPLEQQINGIAGVRSLSSRSQQGRSVITVEFELNVNLETAANDVRDKVSRAQRYLPRDCDPPIVSKQDADAAPIMQITVRSRNRSLLEVSEIASLTVKERLQSISDVSSAEVWGEKRYAMRLWLDPLKMAGTGVTPIDVKNAIDRENLELPSGTLEGDATQLAIRVRGYMNSPEQFDDIIIKKEGDHIVRFRDVGRAELSAEDLKGYLKINGEPMVGVVVIAQPGANQIEIADEVYKRMEAMQKDLPEDITLGIAFDNTKFIRASIAEVQETLYIAFLLVVVVIFLFLRDWRVTLLPVLVIPVCLIGTFFIMYLFGYSINVLTMLAIVLAIGLVVDDAIVVTENIYTKIEDGMSPEEAGIKGTTEIFFAVISTTITLVAVFLPIIFMSGMTGKLFVEFSIVISGSVIISAFVALTFTPMLATKILKKRKEQSFLYRKTEPFFEKLNNAYNKSLNAFLRRKWLAFPVIVIMVAAMIYTFLSIPSETAPTEDRSFLSIDTKVPEGSTFEYLDKYATNVSILADSLVPERSSTILRVNSNSANIRLMLPNIKDRKRSQMEIAASLTAPLSQITAGRAFVRQQSTFGGRQGQPVQYVLQAANLDKLREFLPAFLEEASQSPVLTMVDADLKFNSPELYVNINRDKANLLGVNTRDIGETLQYSLSGQRMGYFYLDGKQYQILGDINRQQRNQPENITSLYVRNNNGEMIQLDNLVSLEEGVTPPTLYRYNRFVSATVSAGLAPGKTIGEGLDEMDRIAKNVLDETFRTSLAGESKEYRDSSSSLAFALILAILLIFLVLAAQFESFKDPLVIMLTVPFAIAGALLSLYFSGLTLNIFSQIGIIMLIGLVTKNGILIVEFANQKQIAGMSKYEAVRHAAQQRFRPILMTSISTILGLLPLVFASAEGANGRIAMGTAVTGGMLLSTFLTLYIIPAMYSYISADHYRKRAKKRLKRLKEED